MIRSKKIDVGKSILIIVLGLIVLYLKFSFNWLLYSALIISFIGSFFNGLSKKIAQLWMSLAWILGLVIPKVILTIIFYLILFPMAILAKICNVNSGIIIKNEQHSFFKNVTKEIDKSSLEKPW